MDREEKKFVESWAKKAKMIAEGTGNLFLGDLIHIYKNLRLDLIKPEFLPNKDVVIGSPDRRKGFIFQLAESLWGVCPERWLELENAWLQEARKISGSSETSGKDKLDDVISAEILIRIVATAKLVMENSFETDLRNEALNALNLSIAEACTKGRTRMKYFGKNTVYTTLRNAGIMIGTGGGKYLPHPEISLKYLFLMLRRDVLCPDVFYDDD